MTYIFKKHKGYFSKNKGYFQKYKGYFFKCIVLKKNGTVLRRN